MNREDKQRLLRELDNNRLTFKEFFELYDAHLQNELAHAAYSAKLENRNRTILLNVLLAAAVAVAVVVSPPVYKEIWGYDSAEECTLDTKSKYAATACYSLYPSVEEKNRLKISNETQKSETVSIPSRQLSDADFSDEPLGILAKPPHGSLHWYKNEEPLVAPFEIRSKLGGDFYVKLTDATSNQNVLGIFVEGGKTVSTKVPVGQYIIKYANGNKWYGHDKYFGDDASYSKATSIFDFSMDNQGSAGYSITLYKVKKGNLSISNIELATF